MHRLRVTLPRRLHLPLRQHSPVPLHVRAVEDACRRVRHPCRLDDDPVAQRRVPVVAVVEDLPEVSQHRRHRVQRLLHDARIAHELAEVFVPEEMIVRMLRHRIHPPDPFPRQRLTHQRQLPAIRRHRLQTFHQRRHPVARLLLPIHLPGRDGEAPVADQLRIAPLQILPRQRRRGALVAFRRHHQHRRVRGHGGDLIQPVIRPPRLPVLARLKAEHKQRPPREEELMGGVVDVLPAEIPATQLHRHIRLARMRQRHRLDLHHLRALRLPVRTLHQPMPQLRLPYPPLPHEHQLAAPQDLGAGGCLVGKIPADRRDALVADRERWLSKRIVTDKKRRQRVQLANLRRQRGEIVGGEDKPSQRRELADFWRQRGELVIMDEKLLQRPELNDFRRQRDEVIVGEGKLR